MAITRVNPIPYRRYLFTTQREALHYDLWPVNSRSRRSISKEVNGDIYRLVFDQQLRRPALYAVTRELEDRFKLVEFWSSRSAYQRHKPALAVQFIAFKPLRGAWQSFWYDIDEMAGFRYLLQRGQVTREELTTVLTHEYLVKYYSAGPGEGINVLEVAEQVNQLPRGRNHFTRNVLTFEVKSKVNATVAAVTKGLGKGILRRWWKVGKNKTGGTFVDYAYQGKRRQIFGFLGSKKVYSHLVEEEDEVRVYFYQDPIDAAKGENLMLAAALSRKDRKTGQWQPLDTPETIFIAPEKGVRKQIQRRLNNRRLLGFLLNRQPEGSGFDLPARKVAPNGTLIFTHTVQQQSSRLCFCGYLKYAGKKLVGRVVTQGEEKRIYFWANKKDRDAGKPAIVPEGHVFARKQRSGWKILWTEKPELAVRGRAYRAYASFLFAVNTGARVYVETWPVQENYHQRDKRTYYFIERQVRGHRLIMYLPKGIKTNEIYSETREVAGGCFKLVAFWASADDKRKGKEPFAVRFITFSPSNGESRRPKIFWARFDEVYKFYALARRGEIGIKELRACFACDYLEKHFGVETFDLIRALEEMRLNKPPNGRRQRRAA